MALAMWLLVVTGVWLVLVSFVVLVLFGAYLALVSRALRGPAPAECGCFGAVGGQTVTRATVACNGLLVLAAHLAVLAALHDVSVLTALIGDGAAWAWILASLLTAGVAALVTRRSPEASAATVRPMSDAGGVYVRQAVPDVQVLTEAGELVLVGSEALSAARLVVFFSPGCGPCQRIAPRVPGCAEALAPVRVHAILLGPLATLEAHPQLTGHAWFDPHGVAHRLLAPGTPSAVLIGTDRLLAGGPVLGEHAVLAFVDEVIVHLECGLAPAQDVSGVR